MYAQKNISNQAGSISKTYQQVCSHQKLLIKWCWFLWSFIAWNVWLWVCDVIREWSASSCNVWCCDQSDHRNVWCYDQGDHRGDGQAVAKQLPMWSSPKGLINSVATIYKGLHFTLYILHFTGASDDSTLQATTQNSTLRGTTDEAGRRRKQPSQQFASVAPSGPRFQCVCITTMQWSKSEQFYHQQPSSTKFF